MRPDNNFELSFDFSNGGLQEWHSPGHRTLVIPLFGNKAAGATLSARKCLIRSRQFQQEGKLTSYCQVVNDLLSVYATDNIVTDADVDIMKYKQLLALRTGYYLHSLWTKASVEVLRKTSTD